MSLGTVWTAVLCVEVDNCILLAVSEIRDEKKQHRATTEDCERMSNLDECISIH